MMREEREYAFVLRGTEHLNVFFGDLLNPLV